VQSPEPLNNLHNSRALLRDLRSRESEMLHLLGKFVRAESPSLDKKSVDDFGRMVAAEWRARGARVTSLRQKNRGDHLLINLPHKDSRADGRILLLGHMDTVYDKGSLAKMPFRVAQGRAWGPATFDMKGGLVLALFAIDALKRAGIATRKEIGCLWTTDEEIGSESSRKFIEREAKLSDAVLVLEPAGEPRGALKTSRKGVGEIEIHVIGRAAHSGLKPEEGINAVHELALQIARIAKFNQPKRGIGVHVNVASGGTRTNVIAAEAHALVDVRVTRVADILPLEQKFRALKPILPGAKLEISGGVDRPPMERKMSAALFQHAQHLAADLGIALEETTSGGGSDGNLTAAIGIPTLDGLGAIGSGAHSLRENILVRELAPRAALIAALLATL
jgi:glutamate carboxypeptidase